MWLVFDPKYIYSLDQYIQCRKVQKEYLNLRSGSSQKSDLCLKGVVKNLGRGLEHTKEGVDSHSTLIQVPLLRIWAPLHYI